MVAKTRLELDGSSDEVYYYLYLSCIFHLE